MLVLLVDVLNGKVVSGGSVVKVSRQTLHQLPTSNLTKRAGWFLLSFRPPAVMQDERDK